MNTKYRTFDYSTNVVLSTKYLSGQYVPSRSLCNPSQKSLKKKSQQPSANCKVYEKNRPYNKILSKSDRLDIYLQGGQINQTNKAQRPIYDNRIFFKGAKLRRKDMLSTTKAYKFSRKSQEQSLYQSATSGSISQEQHNFLSVRKDNTGVRFYKKDSIISQQKIKVQLTSSRDTPKYRATKVSSLGIKSTVSNDSKAKHTINQRKQQLSQSIISNSNATGRLNKPLFYFNQQQVKSIRAESFIVTEYPSGQILVGNYYRKVAQIASLTKIMTCYCIIKLCLQMHFDYGTQKVEIDEQTQETSGTSAQLVEGDVYTVRQLLYGLMLPSGNDAAKALAKWGGTQLLSKFQDQSDKDSPNQAFINYMNKCSKELNMKNSRFYNPHGLPHPQSGSTPEELAILMHECMKFEVFRQIIKTRKFSCYTKNQGVQREMIWQNTHKLLRRKGFIGGKTGVTITAGPCLASCYQSGDKYFIVILLRTTKLSRRFKQTRLILAMTLNKLDFSKYARESKQLSMADKELDSDNSEDQMQFQFDRKDPQEMAKRNKILTYQM